MYTYEYICCQSKYGWETFYVKRAMCMYKGPVLVRFLLTVNQHATGVWCCSPAASCAPSSGNLSRTSPPKWPKWQIDDSECLQSTAKIIWFGVYPQKTLYQRVDQIPFGAGSNKQDLREWLNIDPRSAGFAMPLMFWGCIWAAKKMMKHVVWTEIRRWWKIFLHVLWRIYHSS